MIYRIIILLFFNIITCTTKITSCNSPCNAACTPNCTTSCIDTRSCKRCHSIYLPRSQHSNSAYFSTPAQVNFIDVGVEYQQSFRGIDIAHCLFGTDLLLFQGSQIPTRDSQAIIADYFGLSPFFDGFIRFSPRIQNVNVHISGQYDFDSCSGLYGAVWATLSHQRRTLFEDGACDRICTSTQSQKPFPVGYMAQNAVAPTPSILTALSGNFTFGDMTTPWKFGKIDRCTLDKTGVAGVSLILGYNFVDDACGSLGIFGIYTAPTGGHAHARRLFNPIIGNGGYHEIGAGLSAFTALWRDDEDRSISIYLFGFATTMLAQAQIRSFDFKDRGCLSRYMLLKQLVPPSALDVTIFNDLGDTHGPGFSYNGTLINGINFATGGSTRISRRKRRCINTTALSALWF